MSRPLLITDCDEVLLHMVSHFDAWLGEAHGIRFAFETGNFGEAMTHQASGVYMVPALSGLGAPHWRPEARCMISGISFATTRAHLVRAALEAQAHQVHDLMKAFEADGEKWERLRIDGGMVANNWLAQDLADMLDLTVERPALVETTALGAAMLAAVGAGIHPSLDAAVTGMGGTVTRFEPKMGAEERQRRLAGWKEALERI